MKIPEIKIRIASRATVIKPILFAVIMLAAILPIAGCSSITDAVAATTPVKTSVHKTSSSASETTQATTSQTTISEVGAPSASPGTSGEDITAGWKTYTNDEYGFEIKYPEELQAKNTFEPYNHLDDQWRVAVFGDTNGKPVVSILVYRIENESTYPRYFDAELRIGVSLDPQDLASCGNPDAYLLAAVPPVEVINGITFNRLIIQDAGMMQYLEGISYRTVHDGMCFAVEQLKTGSNYRDESSPEDIPDAVLDSYYNSIADIIKTFKFTRTAPAAINMATISGITAPVKGETAYRYEMDDIQYTATLAWNGSPATFAVSTVYTATITITPKAGYTLTGVAENFFTVWGATSTTNTANSGVVTAVFPATAPLAVGDSYGGGKVAYIFVSGDTGYISGQKHGLIAATEDQSAGIQWYNGSFTRTEATATALGTGLTNTNTIIAAQGPTATNYAAGLARAYNGGGFSDWFLPSKDELNKLYLNKNTIGGFWPADYYWSSSEDSFYYAWTQPFNMNFLVDYIKSSSYPHVRAVRYF